MKTNGLAGHGFGITYGRAPGCSRDGAFAPATLDTFATASPDNWIARQVVHLGQLTGVTEQHSDDNRLSDHSVGQGSFEHL